MASIREIAPGEASAKLAEFLPVDVRGAHEFAGPLGHIPGALSIPLPELEARVGEIPRGRPLLMICRSGVRSIKAIQQLESHGLAAAANLTGGMIAWNRAGLAVERPRYRSVAALIDNALAWLAQVSAQTPADARAKLDAALGAAVEAPTPADGARALDWIEAAAQAAGPPPDTDLSLAAFRTALRSL
jgi:rhodanese-related sulfurtransferase